MALAGCSSLYVLANSGKMLDASGREVGTQGEAQVDIGDVRVGLSKVYAARALTIPTAYYLSFTRSPAGVARIHRSKGDRAATAADWQQHKALLLQARRRQAKPTSNGASLAGFERYMDQAQAKSHASEYETVVFPDGLVGSCQATTRSRDCGTYQGLSRPDQKRLAQLVLDRVKPGCRLARIDPQEVVTLPGHLKSRANALLAVVECS